MNKLQKKAAEVFENGRYADTETEQDVMAAGDSLFEFVMMYALEDPQHARDRLKAGLEELHKVNDAVRAETSFVRKRRAKGPGE